jgi:hypothetical protein
MFGSAAETCDISVKAKSDREMETRIEVGVFKPYLEDPVESGSLDARDW